LGLPGDGHRTKRSARERSFKAFPLLECAILNGANLSRLPLALLWRSVEGKTTPDVIGVGDSLTVPALNLVKLDKNTQLDALGVLLISHVDNHVYLQLPPDRRQRFGQDFYVDNYPWPVGFAGMASLSNVNSSSVEGSATASAGSSDELAFVKRRVLFVGNSTGIDGWAKPLFKVGLDQTIWKSLPISFDILNQPQVDTKWILRADVGGGAPPKDCSQRRISDVRSLMVNFSYLPQRAALAADLREGRH
jgi:hypothetical protein